MEKKVFEPWTQLCQQLGTISIAVAKLVGRHLQV